ncbi:MAG TPA: hypothetical protein VKW76_16935 [Candidatus Binatia bacterium]|nr:hypothetical protein [Candidatus Binatia bacterium]
MTRRDLTLLLSLGVLLAAGVARAAEDVHSHAAAVQHKVIVIDTDRISPSALTMSADDVLEFENFAFNPMMIVFVEPKEQADKIRCHLIGGKAGSAGRASWQLFGWGPGQQLTATIPPGRFASVCSLVPGEYTFVAKRAARATGAHPGATLGMKGTITVQ